MAERLSKFKLDDMRNFNRIGSDSVVEILFTGEAPDLRVRFKDWSVAGACLILEDADLLPSTFFIRKPRADADAPTVRCEMLWRKGNQVGVQFVAPAN